MASSGAFEIGVASGAPNLALHLRAVAEEQIPFATALALTRIGAKIQAAGREQLEQRFDVRAPWFTRSMGTTLVRKQDWPHQKVQIGHPWWKVKMHELGGELTGGSKHPGEVFIPTRAVASMRGANGKIPNEMRPDVLLSSGAARIAKLDGFGRVVVMNRFQKLRKRSIRPGGFQGFGAVLNVAYLVRDSAAITPRFGFFELAEKRARELYADIFRDALDHAIATARPRFT